MTTNSFFSTTFHYLLFIDISYLMIGRPPDLFIWKFVLLNFIIKARKKTFTRNTNFTRHLIKCDKIYIYISFRLLNSFFFPLYIFCLKIMPFAVYKSWRQNFVSSTSPFQRYSLPRTTEDIL
jgi:hypothetical protein